MRCSPRPTTDPSRLIAMRRSCTCAAALGDTGSAIPLPSHCLPTAHPAATSRRRAEALAGALAEALPPSSAHGTLTSRMALSHRMLIADHKALLSLCLRLRGGQLRLEAAHLLRARCLLRRRPLRELPRLPAHPVSARARLKRRGTREALCALPTSTQAHTSSAVVMKRRERVRGDRQATGGRVRPLGGDGEKEIPSVTFAHT